MDANKELAVLKFISLVWGREVTDILQLRDGDFLIHVVELLEPVKKSSPAFDTSRERHQYIRTFLQDFYGENVLVDKFINFDAILGETETSEDQLKIELAKIAVVLLGIGILCTNRKSFMECALAVPQELQDEVLALIQSVVIPESTEVTLTNRIEEVLRGIKDQRNWSSSTVSRQADTSIEKWQDSVGTQFSPRNLFIKDQTPERQIFLGNASFTDIASPFKTLDIRSPSSSLVNFTNSPQFIQKALIKEKDVELRKLRELLNTEILLKEEAQLNLQDKLLEMYNKDGEIQQLHERIRELQMMMSVNSEQELKNMKTRVEQLQEEIKSLLKYKEQCEILEKESSESAQEISKLHFKIKDLEAQAENNKDSLKNMRRLAAEVKKQEEELSRMAEEHVRLQEDRNCLQANLELARERNKHLKQCFEELQIKHNESIGNQGESMGIILELQLGDLRRHLEESRAENLELMKQLETLKTENESLKSQYQAYQKHNAHTNASLSAALKLERDTNIKMKKRMDSYVAKYEEIKSKFEENENLANEVTRLREALQELQQRNDNGAVQQDINDHGYDSIHSSPDLPKENSASNVAHNVTATTEICESVNTDTVGGNQPTRNLSHKVSTSSLQSFLDIKMLPNVMPTAMSCANEPDGPDYEWDRLSNMSQLRDKKMGENYWKGNMKRKSPMKETTNDGDGRSGNQVKQRKSEGTVIYFPLDKNGPIYPPPKPMFYKGTYRRKTAATRKI